MRSSVIRSRLVIIALIVLAACAFFMRHVSGAYDEDYVNEKTEEMIMDETFGVAVGE